MSRRNDLSLNTTVYLLWAHFRLPNVDSDSIALDATGYQVQTKPHGHGDVHSLLHLSGTVKSWIKAGLTHMFIFQVSQRTAPAFSAESRPIPC